MLPLLSVWGHLYGLYKLIYVWREKGEGGFGVKLLPGICLEATR